MCVLPNHSKDLTCLASVLVLVNASISMAAMEGFSATNSAAIAPTNGLWNNDPVVISSNLWKWCFENCGFPAYGE